MNLDKIKSFVFDRDYFTDKVQLATLGVFFGTGLLNLLFLLLQITSKSYTIPIKYNGYFGSTAIERGQWQELYIFVFFLVIVLVAMFSLSIKFYNIRRTLSLVALMLGTLINVFTFLVARALFVIS